MDNKNLTIVAILALASLLASCKFMSSEIAFACGHQHSKFTQQTAHRLMVAETESCRQTLIVKI